MLKRLYAAVAALFVLASPAFAAGTIPLSLSQQLDNLGKPLSGCKLYLYQAGTVATPQNGYQDTGLTIPLPNPVICDAYGRLPQFFLADGSIKVRLTSSNGSTIYTADNILVIGPSGGGGGGGGGVDPTTILATGDMKLRYGTGVLSGFVRANGRTIGSATSGATERANSDCQTLFEYLWNTDPNQTVSGGRGVSSNADWTANKTITLPDLRGRAIAGLDDMGNSAAGRLSVTYFGTSPTVLGAAGGSESKSLILANLPPFTPSGAIALTTSVTTTTTVTGTATVTSTASNFITANSILSSNAAGGANAQLQQPASLSTVTSTGSISASASSSSSATTTGTFTGNAAGGSSSAFSVNDPKLLMTIYVKL